MAWRCSSTTRDGLVAKLRSGGLFSNDRVEQALRSVDRGVFVPFSSIETKYEDAPQRIGYNATISAPHMHAMCLELLIDKLIPGNRALDVGSGTGYLTACMGVLVRGKGGKAVGVEHIPELAAMGRQNVQKSNPDLVQDGTVVLLEGDGRAGAEEHAPFDAIHVGAAAPELPEALVRQLRVGGRMVIPVGPEGEFQELLVVEKDAAGTVHVRSETGVAYVPLTDRAAQWKE